LVRRLGWTEVDVYIDNDMSASKGIRRPEYERMLADIEAGLVDAVVVWHTDRLTRQIAELERLMLLAEQHGVVFSTVVAGELDLSTAAGRLVARLLGAVARHESELKGERQAAKARQLAYSGRPTGGGSRPFGWVDLARSAIDPTEAAVIQDCAERVLAGESPYSVATWLNREGIRTSRGRDWHVSVLKRMLTSPTLAGFSTYKGKVVAKGQWEPILDEDLHQLLVQRLSYGTGAAASRARVALLPKMVWCGICGYELVTGQVWRPDGPNVRVYECKTRMLVGWPGYGKSCGRITVKAEAIEDDIAERVIARLSRTREAALLDSVKHQDQAPIVGKAIAAAVEVENRLTQLGADFGDGLIGRTEFLAARERLNARLRECDTVIGSPKIEVPRGDAAALVEWWEKAELPRRRALVAQVVARVVVNRHKGSRSTYDRTRAQVEWR
jgi:DNA invertase Pin-like site-specific DNA recombinase